MECYIGFALEGNMEGKGYIESGILWVDSFSSEDSNNRQSYKTEDVCCEPMCYLQIGWRVHGSIASALPSNEGVRKNFSFDASGVKWVMPKVV